MISSSSSIPISSNYKFQTFRNMVGHGVGLVGLLVGMGFSCASDPPPRPAHLDPSNSSAAESKPIGPDLSQPPIPVDAGLAPAIKQADAPGGYTCPMHPEVFSPTPGRCPKCGMTLVPKESGGRDGAGGAKP